jgi:hypothetical protein
MARFKRAFPGRPFILRGPSPAQLGTPGPPRSFVARNPVPARARLGSQNQVAAGISAQNYPPQSAPPFLVGFTRGISMWR